jgi:hypothetical protein
MARLLKSTAKGHWDKMIWRGGKGCNCKTVQTCIQTEQSDLEAIGWDNIMSFPIADGKAFYKVIKERPLTLQHIPFGDAYEVYPALIKGLDAEDLVLQRNWEATWKNKGADGYNLR